jgi:hypothetical protein
LKSLKVTNCVRGTFRFFRTWVSCLTWCRRRRQSSWRCRASARARDFSGVSKEEIITKNLSVWLSTKY